MLWTGALTKPTETRPPLPSCCAKSPAGPLSRVPYPSGDPTPLHALVIVPPRSFLSPASLLQQLPAGFPLFSPPLISPTTVTMATSRTLVFRTRMPQLHRMKNKQFQISTPPEVSSLPLLTQIQHYSHTVLPFPKQTVNSYQTGFSTLPSKLSHLMFARKTSVIPQYLQPPALESCLGHNPCPPWSSWCPLSA